MREVTPSLGLRTKTWARAGPDIYHIYKYNCIYMIYLTGEGPQALNRVLHVFLETNFFYFVDFILDTGIYFNFWIFLGNLTFADLWMSRIFAQESVD